MIITLSDDKKAARRARILTAARWCFLNFGFAKTAFEDIAKRAALSRTLLSRIFKDKEDIYRAVYTDWVICRHPTAKEVANGPGSPFSRLLSISRLLAIEPWSEMVTAPMGDAAIAEIFLLALYGLFADHPSLEVMEQRAQLLAARFAPRSSKTGARS